MLKFHVLWIRVLNNGIKFVINSSIINTLNTGNFSDQSITNFIIATFNNALLFGGVPEDIRSVYIHGNVGHRHVYGYVMYIRRYRSASIHIGTWRIKRDFSKCATYWGGWQVLAHEIAHLVGIGSGHYLRHGNIHLNVTKELLLESLPSEIAIPATYYLLIDYLLGIECKGGYSKASRDFIINELNRLTNDYLIDVKHYINCSVVLRSLIRSCNSRLMRYA
ncbi:hypothetical protein [Vulcanisaeta distributa]|uniref:hypothetical protein n=1 Tax=Vulcanisaeta distributa TaxID=164451 RepID=UPI0006D2A968|nr:hypothetical protein [Vulcanisaeta distributa]